LLFTTLPCPADDGRFSAPDLPTSVGLGNVKHPALISFVIFIRADTICIDTFDLGKEHPKSNREMMFIIKIMFFSLIKTKTFFIFVKD